MDSSWSVQSHTQRWWHLCAQGDGRKQKPIDVVAEYKCSAINVNLKATVGQLGEVGPLVAASSISLGARDEDAWAVGQLESAVSMPAESSDRNEGSAAGDRVMAYLGDHQVCHGLHTICGRVLMQHNAFIPAFVC